MSLYVTKRDGSVEQFEETKIVKVAHAAGLEDDQAQKLCQSVRQFFEQSSQEKVTSLQIRDKVLEIMKQIDNYSANMFEWYEKTKEK